MDSVNVVPINIRMPSNNEQLPPAITNEVSSSSSSSSILPPLRTNTQRSKKRASMPPPPPGYHPEFLYCGACTNCSTGSSHHNNNNNNTTPILLPQQYASLARHRIQILFLQDSPKHPMVLESLIREERKQNNNLLQTMDVVSVDGPTAVLEYDPNTAAGMEYDVSAREEALLTLLTRHNYPAQLVPLSSNDKNLSGTDTEEGTQLLVVAKTILSVQGICCPTEVPSIRAILQPLKCQIFIATKRVHVWHDRDTISAQAIAETLTDNGFPTRIIRQEGHNNQTPKPAKRSKQQHKANVAIDSAEDSRSVSSHDSDEEGDDDNDDDRLPGALPERSSFVESTLTLSDYEYVVDETRIERALQSIQYGISSFSYVSSCQTLKIQHNPKQVSCENIVQQLHNESGLSAEIVIDGAVDRLYLPMEIVTSLEHAALQEMEDKHSKRLRIHVILSGIFWLVSMVSIILGLKWLEYFGLLSVAFGLPPVAKKAWRTARRREFDANCMMVTAAIGALILGEIDEAASVSFLFSVSEYLETKATERARKALEAIIKLRPEYANLIHPVTKEIIIVPSEKVRVGSLVSVRTGDKIAADGVVVEGTSSVDESSLTGESAPVNKAIGSAVSGGTINVGMTQLVVKTTTTVEDSAVSRLIRLVEEATVNMSPTEKMIDSFARAYTPAVVSMAAIMATVPWIFGVETGRYWTLNALIIIVISCPCALTISTPVTYAAGLAAAAQKGIVVKGGASLEALGSVDKCLFDKTGTLTRGKFSVIHLDLIGEKRSRKEMLSLLALMEAPSSHPLSATLVNAARKEGVSIPMDVRLEEHSILKGEGIEATVNEKQVYVGNKRLFERLGMYEQMPLNNKTLAETWMKQGGTIGFLGVEDEGILAAFCMIDEVRSGAKETVEALVHEGIDVMLLTGDSDSAANAVAKKVGIPSGGVHSQLLPEDKLHLVGSFKRPPQRNNFGLMRRNPKVLFVGDGVNDAPAIAVADVGVSMGEGAAIAMEISDVTLMDSNIEKLVFILKMGKRVMYTVQENIILSLLCKVVVVALTFAGYMTLLFAIASDIGVMLLVTLNGLKLLPGDTHGPLKRLRRMRYTQIELQEAPREIV